MSLDALGLTQTVTVTATSTSIYADTPSVLSDESSFEVSFANPCINPDFVYIQEPALFNKEYSIFTAAIEIIIYDTFEIITEPRPHVLCGDMTFTAKFNDLPLVVGEPLTYS